MICAPRPFASCLFPDLLHLVSSCMPHFHSPPHVFFPSIKVIGDFYLKEPQASSASCLLILFEKVAHIFLSSIHSSNSCNLVSVPVLSWKALNNFLIAKSHAFLSPHLSFFLLFDGVPFPLFQFSILFPMVASSPSWGVFWDSHCLYPYCNNGITIDTDTT